MRITQISAGGMYSLALSSDGDCCALGHCAGTGQAAPGEPSLQRGVLSCRRTPGLTSLTAWLTMLCSADAQHRFQRRALCSSALAMGMRCWWAARGALRFGRNTFPSAAWGSPSARARPGIQWSHVDAAPRALVRGAGATSECGA